MTLLNDYTFVPGNHPVNTRRVNNLCTQSVPRFETN